MNNGMFDPNNGQFGSNPMQNGGQFDDGEKQFKSSRKLTLVGNIAGPVSLFIGGTLLSTVGIICAILGMRKMKALSQSGSAWASRASIALKASKVSVGVCAVALVLNVITMAILFGEMQQLIEAGNYEALMNNFGIGGSSTSSNSTWG